MCFVPLQGDFSFIESRELRQSLEWDYKHCFKKLQTLSIDMDESFREGERNSLDSDRPNVWDTPPGSEWKSVTDVMYPTHIEQTYNRNIKYLNHIKEKGWKSYLRHVEIK